MKYNARHSDLSGLKGISDATLEQHFKLYEGYVAQTNALITKLAELNKNGGGVDDEWPESCGMTSRSQAVARSARRIGCGSSIGAKKSFG